MPGRPLSRRTTLGSALAAPLVLAACDIDPPSPDADPSGATPPPPEDSELVATVVAALVDAEAVLVAAGTAVPALYARLEPLIAAHAAHRELLAGAIPDAEQPTASPATVPPVAAGALRAVRRSEQQLLRTLRDGCLGAASGDLARVLASMAASTSQHAAALTAGVTS
ncbi:hypothetical protein J2X46_002624 [Nocardioides sp. BE266]|uniref:hypothetical protein n=1 Tax=Nocardioides sp. BE266 TaxID=2817725 RepID=UPI00286569F3|nr:hypothetical protein [Nocardioides sp. BE266]MDR7253634.1 hypothetical protein [Nocardioides sp. BE266]